MHDIRYCRALRSLAGPWAALTLLLWLPWASAGSFSVNPVRVTLSADKKVAALEVRNTGATETSIQLETVAWTQDANGDVYKPADNLLATPPIFTLPAGESQLIRVGLRQLPKSDKELPFRLFLLEIPSPADESVTGLRIALQLGVPVFLEPEGDVSPELQWQAKRLADGRLQLRASNRGRAHAQFGPVSLKLPHGDAIRGEIAGYVLPGYNRWWELTPGTTVTAGDRLQLEAQVNGRSHSATIKVE